MSDAQSKTPSFQFGLRHLLIAVGLVGVLLGLTVPFYRALEEAALRVQCGNNFKQVGIALHNYHDVYKRLPPSRYVAADGTLLHSWRPGIMPFAESSSFYEVYSFTEPWNGPNNIKLVKGLPVTYHHDRGSGTVTEVFDASPMWQCPHRRDKKGYTSIVAITGPGTAFPADNQSTRFADFTDGLSTTIIAAEIDHPNIHWLEPRDLDVRTMSFVINDRSQPSISSHHGEPAVLFGNASVRRVHPSIPAATLRALLTIAGGEAIDIEQLVAEGYLR